MNNNIRKSLALIFAVLMTFSAFNITENYIPFTASAVSSASVNNTPTLKASKIKSTSLKLSWSKVKNVSSYKVYRSTNNKKWKLIKTTDKAYYTVKSLKKGTTYYFRVRAYIKKSGKTTKGKYSTSISVNTKTKAVYTYKTETVYATTGVNIRKKASASSGKAGRLKKNESIKRTAVGNNGWSKVSLNGKTLYIKSSYLTTKKPVVTTTAAATTKKQEITTTEAVETITTTAPAETTTELAETTATEQAETTGSSDEMCSTCNSENCICSIKECTCKNASSTTLQMNDYFADMYNSEETFKIVLGGDSITHGLGGTGWAQSGEKIITVGRRTWRRSPDSYCWANLFEAYIEENYNATVTNNACTGTNSTMWNTNKEVLIPADTDLFVLMIGTNDRNVREEAQTKDVQLRKYEENLRSIVDYCHSLGIKILLCSPIPATRTNEEQELIAASCFELNGIVQKVAASYNMPYVNMYNEVFYYAFDNGRDYNTLLVDGLHPTDELYRIMYLRFLKTTGLAPHYGEIT